MTTSISSLPCRTVTKFFISFGFILLLCTQSINAQSGATPLALAPGSPAGSYHLSDIDTVNLFNGRVSIRMPIVTAQGRGDAVGPIIFNSGSPASWHVRSDVDGNGQPIYYAEPGGGGALATDGLSMGLAQVYGVQAGSQTSFPCSMGDYYTFQKTLTRLYFVEPDGTEHEMRDVQTGGQALSISICALNGPSRGKVFVSTDGSGATFIADANVTDYIFAGGDFPIISPPGYLLLSNGTRYRVNDISDSLVTLMRDRNGNQLSGKYINNLPVFQYQIKDSLNRELTRNLGACPPPNNGSCPTLFWKGYNGSIRGISTIGSPMRLVLPNNLEYKFYTNEYGDLTRIDLPTGGSIEYDIGPGIDGPQPDVSNWIQGAIPGTYMIGIGNGVVYRRVTERRVYKVGHVLQNRQTFSKPEYFDGSNLNPYNLGYVDKKQYDSNNNLINTERHFFYGAATNSFYVGPIDYPSWKEGREYHSEIYDQNGSLVRQTNLSWEQRTTVPWWGGSADAAPQMDPRLAQSTTILENGQSSTTTNVYDATVPYNSLTDVYVYDFTAAQLRRTQTTYVKTLNGTDYTGINITNPTLPYMRELISQISVFEGSTERRRTTFEYDNYTTDTNHAGLVARTNINGLESSYTTTYIYRGNVTGITSSLLTNGQVTGSISNYMQYDVAGNLVKSIDGRGFATTIQYNDCFGGPNGEAQTNSAPSELSSVSKSSFAFPTLVTNTFNQTTLNQYDYYLGQVVDTQDANGVVSSAAFNDSLDRPTQITKAANQSTALKSQTTFSYDDAARTVTTTGDMSSFNDPNPLKSQTIYDSLGRVSETRRYEGGTNYIVTEMQYDDLGRLNKESNPYRPWKSETPVWTTTAFDALSRVISVTTPDGASVGTAYTGNSMTVTDQAGKQRKTVNDALGRVTQVNEAPNDASYNYQTTYSYDVLDNLTTVNQGSQTRSFSYDSLSRLTSSTLPERGTITYGYDNNGNLITKLDARNITTTLSYDGLNRLTSVSRNDSPQTPTVNYFYDAQTLPSGAPTFDRGSSTGRLVAVTYGGGSAGTYRGYDARGRVVRQYQRTDSVNYLVEAAYNQADLMTSQTYPSVPGAADRRTISYTPDAAGRLASLSTSATSYAPGASESAVGYAAHNAVATETYGSNLIHAISYNDRLQPTNITLGPSAAPSSIVSISLNFGTTDNNGNLLTSTYDGDNGTVHYTQTFTYDPLNRLATATETIPSGRGFSLVWSQTNGYDRYGNRWVDLGGGIQSLYFNTSNRITGLSYDNAGNLLNDGSHAYTYDAENKILKVDNTLAYVYDGEGRRVNKLVNENLRFVYGIDGQQIAEFNGSTGALQKEYIYGASGLVATIEPTAVNTNGTRYSTPDQLGSARVITNSSGSVVSRHDYMPFGEEIFTGGWRTSFSGYGVADGLRQKFTAQERDSETGLDYMKARYFSSVAGRFTTPDPALGSGRAAIPQSWNRYAYTLGNPLKYIDPTGLFEWDASLRDDPKLSAGEREKRRKLREAFLKALQDAKEQAKKLTGEKQKKLNDALNAYGEKDTANGVTVGVGTDKGHVGDTLPTFYINDKWNGVTPNIEVKFDPKVLLSDDAMVAVAHEGAHVEDAFTFANSYDALTDLKPEDRLKDPRDATQYDTENHAFHVQSYLFEAMGKNDGKWGTWQKSWAELDKKEPNGEEKARQGAVTKTIKDYYGWTEQNKGWNMGSRACKQPNC